MDEMPQTERVNYDRPSVAGISQPTRVSEVQREMDALRNTESKLAKITEQLFTTFSGVVSPREPSDGNAVAEKEAPVSAPLPSNIREIREGFERSIKQLRFLISSSEL